MKRYVCTECKHPQLYFQLWRQNEPLYHVDIDGKLCGPVKMVYHCNECLSTLFPGDVWKNAETNGTRHIRGRHNLRSRAPGPVHRVMTASEP